MASVTEYYKLKFSIFMGLLLAASSILLRYWAFAQTDFATGWDGYYYLVQLKSLEEAGRMHSPEGSLIYPYLQVFYWLTGDYVAAIKWGSALLCGCWTLLVCFLPRQRSMGLVLAAWTVFSPHLTYFAAQYPKNMLGMVLMLALITAVQRKGKNKWILVFSLLIINYFGHRMNFCLSLLYLLVTLLIQLKKPSTPAWMTRRNLAAVLLAFVLIMLAGSLIPGVAQLIDLQRLQGTCVVAPQFAPWSFFRTFGWEKISGFWLMELGAVLWVLAVRLVQVLGRRQQTSIDYALLAICLLLLFPFLEWSLTGISWRFFLAAVPLIPLLLQGVKFQPYYRFAIPVLLLGSCFSWKSYVPAQHDPNYALFSRVTQQVMQHFYTGVKPELIIAHNALAEYFTFSTGIDAIPWLPEYAIDSTRLWRIATGIRPETLRYYAGSTALETVIALGSGYLLLPEFVWQNARSNAETAGDDYFISAANTWLNPNLVRPAWLLQKKKR